MPVVPSDSDRETLAATSRLIWIIVAAMLAAICAGYWAAGLSLDIWTCRYVVPIVPLCAAIAWFYRTRRPDPWIAQGAESVAQVLAILLAGTLLTYAAAAACFPYRDHELNATDIALGFDWRAYLNFVNAHPWLGLLCHGAYFCKRGKTRGGMILRFSGGRESDSFWECRRPEILTVCRTPS